MTHLCKCDKGPHADVASLTSPETIRSAKLEAALIICDEVYDEFDGEIPLVLQRQADRIVDGVLTVLRSVEEGKT